MEVNLLNSTGIHRKEKYNFNEVNNSFISQAEDDLSVDFESRHTVEKKTSVKGRKNNLSIICFFTVIIIVASFYYKFIINKKTFIESQKLQSLIEYVVNVNDLNLLEFNFDDYSIHLRFEIDSKNVFTENLKVYLDDLAISDNYKTEISKYKDRQIMSIKYPPFLEVVNSNFNKDLDSRGYDMIDKINIDKNTLNNFLKDIFNINSPKIANFKINRIDKNHYNIQFPK